MTDVQVTLDFGCCTCEQPVNVTVRCQGKGLESSTFGGVAVVNVPCPTCSAINQVYFEPNGTLRSVRSLRHHLAMPEPSIN